MNSIITNKVAKIKQEVQDKFGVLSIGVFGSCARGEQSVESDIDILVEFKKGFSTFDNYMNLKFYLQDVFQRRVDLVTVNALRPQLKEDILQEVIYA